LGIYSSYNVGVATSFVLFYALAVLLAGMLYGSGARWMVVIFSTLAHFLVGSLRTPISFEQLISGMITLLCGLWGVSLLQAYFNSRLTRLMDAQTQANQELVAEIAHRKDVEKNLRGQQEQFRRLAENITDLVLEMDLSGTIRYASPSHRQVLNVEPHTLIGTNAYKLVHENDLALALTVAQRSLSMREPSRVQLLIRHGNGYYLPMEVSGRLILTEDGEASGFLLSSRDVSAQKAAEAAIHASESKFRSIIETLPLGIHFYSLDAAGRIILNGYNPAANAILDLDHAPLLGKTLEEAFPRLAATEAPQRFREVLASGQPWTCERLQTLPGSNHDVFEIHAFQISPGNVAALFESIGARIRSAEELRLSEEKFGTV